LANDYHWRSTKAKKQLRDRLGRWISLGANVRYRADGKEQAGVVTSVINGKAYVDQKNRDGSVTQKIIDPSAIRVLASKATLPPDGKKILDEKNSFADALKSGDYTAAMKAEGKALIERADGYALSAAFENEALGMDQEAHDGTEGQKEKSTGNPVLYQLFAPGGRSLGQYSEGAEGDFDAMVEGDKADTAPDGSGEAAPAEAAPTSGGAVAASVSVLGEEKPFRVPEAVKSEIADTLSNFSSLPEADLAVAKRLANDSTVSLSDVQWVHGFFAENDLSERLRGGFKGRKWASKIVESSFSLDEPEDEAGHPKYQFDDDVFAYFAIGIDPGSTIVNKLISVNYETGEVFQWGGEGFFLIPEMDMTEVDEPQIIPIDEMTADTLAHWIDSCESEDYDILDTDTEERNLFSLAASELDFEELDRAYAVIAAAGDGVYTPTERSQNAKTQGRGAGGKFGETPDAPKAKTVTDHVEDEPKAERIQKARLPVALPLVANPAARISEWLSTAAEAPVVAAGEAPVDEQYTEEDQAVEDAATGPTDEALYFAIVDEIDKTAVMDAIAIVKQGGQPSTFIRSNGAWTPSPDTLTILQGSTPPPVVELPDPETVRTVLEQIDAHDAGADQTEVSDEMAPKEGEVPIAASGFAMPDGSYTIIKVEDIKEAVVASGATPDLFVKAHIRKRARALNRMDLIPAAWREFTLAEIGELSASKGLYGEFGEILVASGAPKHGGSEAQLRAYWTIGKGALKIRWGTPGDLTRCHRHLSKYVGPQRAWGLAQSYHKTLFGVYNHTHDVATGQYVSRKKK
jgi:hypothetical protein